MKKNTVILLNALPDKKIKSLGNKCLITISKQKNILDYHIASIKKIYKNPEIIIVCGFDSKKLKKYIEQKYKDLIYLEHNIDDYTNIGTSLQLSIPYISGQNCLIMNTNSVLYIEALNKIKQNKDESFVLISNHNCEIGCIYENNKILNCYYDLPNPIYDLLYICAEQLEVFKKLLSVDLSKLFLFEIINLCIDRGISIRPVSIDKRSIILIDSIKNIQKVKKKLCSI